MELSYALGLSWLLTAVLLYKWITGSKDFFRNKPIPSVPFFSLRDNTYSLFLKQTDLGAFTVHLYNKFAGAKIFGIFDTIKPVFVVRDPELIKQITVKDFDHFVDRPALFGYSFRDDPYALFSKMLPVLHGARWRNMRNILSPAFTGSKMKQMFQLALGCCDNVVQFLNSVQQEQQHGEVEMLLKDVTSRYGTDVISCCLFGRKLNSFQDRKNKFYTYGMDMIVLHRIVVVLKMFLIRCFPALAAKIKVDLLDRKHAKYFNAFVDETIEDRTRNNIKGNTLIDMMIEVQLHQQSQESVLPVTFTNHEIVAQLLTLFLAGSGTFQFSSVALIHDLIMNPDVQQKLYEEILQTQSELGTEKLNYDTIQNMKYMEMVTLESMRLHTSFSNAYRHCVKDYTVDDGNGLKFNIHQGSNVWIPILGLHMDPKYFPDPKRFDPERFNAENRPNIHPATYIPFGAGPRNCVARRFGLMKVKALLYHLLLNFSITASPNTPKVLPMNKAFAFLDTVDGDFPVTFKRRQKN
ncbi:cytochrome P450 9b1 [Culex quinquefasciatus]|uniref:Cytochrome P450 9b1 n=1 Tax=Culex quinquefasciatus TaxID=7176 RepID=B0WU75_CULQU|nr:cytochrome P450 9b1 [Culex quinquefasciatus]|eukprot:XP_001870910.1 cytochrome P450 9b1 [Culex quinquefasciatus]